MHAIALEHAYTAIKTKLDNNEPVRILDTGSGSGYLTAVFAQLVRNSVQSRVYGIEHIQQLVDNSIQSIKSDPNTSVLYNNNRIKIIQGDGRLGLPQYAPYDVIHCGAAALKEHVQHIQQQLNINGVLIAPVGSHDQRFVAITRVGQNEYKTKHITSVRYIPLTDVDKQINE